MSIDATQVAATGHIVLGTPWKMPTDDQLSWFRAGPPLPVRPTPLQYTLDVQAFTFAFAHALVSLYFSLYRVRSRLIDGQLYLAVVPSGLAELDVDRQMVRLRASTLRFSRDIRASWEREIRGAVEDYIAWVADFPAADATGPQAAEGFVQLRRTRSNQWFDSIRAVFAPAALAQDGIGDTLPADAMEVLKDARDVVIARGTTVFDAAIRRVGERLAQAGSIDTLADITWLEYTEVRDALDHGGKHQEAVQQRRTEHEQRTGPLGPDTVGPSLPPDAPRMYLVHEVLGLLTNATS